MVDKLDRWIKLLAIGRTLLIMKLPLNSSSWQQDQWKNTRRIISSTIRFLHHTSNSIWCANDNSRNSYRNASRTHRPIAMWYIKCNNMTSVFAQEKRSHIWLDQTRYDTRRETQTKKKHWLKAYHVCYAMFARISVRFLCTKYLSHARNNEKEKHLARSAYIS